MLNVSTAAVQADGAPFQETMSASQSKRKVRWRSGSSSSMRYADVSPVRRDRCAHERHRRDVPVRELLEYPACAAGDGAVFAIEGDLPLPAATKGQESLEHAGHD